MQNPHEAAEDNEASEIDSHIRPGDYERCAGVDDDNAESGKHGAVGMPGAVWVVATPTDIHPPNETVQQQAGNQPRWNHIDKPFKVEYHGRIIQQ